MYLNLAETLVIKEQNLFLISLRDGCLPHAEAHPLGLYFQDCRHLSAYEWRLNGEVPLLLQASDARGTRALHELTNPGVTLADGSTVAPQSLSVRLDRRFAEPANMRERLVLSSHHREDLRLDLELRIAADFAPMLAIRGLVPSKARPVEPEVDGDSLVFAVMGRDGILRSTRVESGVAPRRWEGAGSSSMRRSLRGARTSSSSCSRWPNPATGSHAARPDPGPRLNGPTSAPTSTNATRTRPREPGVEGLVGRGPRRRGQAAGRAGRARRGSGLCHQGAAPDRAAARPRRGDGSKRPGSGLTSNQGHLLGRAR
jgi:hypothetical protein